MAPILLHSLDELATHIELQQHPHISFHHHLRNGDFVVNMVLEYYRAHDITNLHLHPSSIFPSYTSILTMLNEGRIQSITTNYINGPVGDFISRHGLPGELRMQTHGGRARNIIDGTTTIDIAYLAAPTVDHLGNAIGYQGPSQCGSLGYAIADSRHATYTVLLTDHLVDEVIPNPEIHGKDVDFILLVNQLGDPRGIVSGTTAITTNPIGVKIAKQAATLVHELGYIKPGFSYQSGAGGTSLRVTKDIRDIMIKEQIKASFFSGGITAFHVKMLEEGLVERLYDVQCFDTEAVRSIRDNPHHIPISASQYANPANPNQVISNLDVVILGATEVDLDFNVNVTTDSHQTIIGGSGGHSDTASESKLCIIVSPLIRGRLPLIKERVTTITTLGEHVDVIVTERGIAINPRRNDIIQSLQNSLLPLYPINTLMEIAHSITGIPNETKQTTTPIGVIEDRTQRIIDILYKNN